MKKMAECLKCGKCCEILTVEPVVRNRKQKQFFLARGFQVVGGNLKKILKDPCPHLTEDNLCDLHGTLNKPKLCSEFPLGFDKNLILEGCGFKK